MNANTSDVSLAVVLGGGGWFGIGYNLGVVDGLREAGVELDAAPLLGTSAGSWAAAATAAGVSFAELVELPTGRFPDPRPGVLARTARLIFGEQRQERVSVVACQVPRLNRCVLSGSVHPVADLVAASSAVPGLLAPHRVGGSLYLDGGVRSTVSADLAPAASHLLVIAPMGGEVLGRSGRRVRRQTDHEVRQWQTQGSGVVTVLAPEPDLSRHARLPHRLFDRDLARVAYDSGRRQGAACGATVLAGR